MPAGDRTGPRGMGPRTGRAAGYCSGFGVPGYANPSPGLGRGWGFGRGFGARRGRGRGWGAWGAWANDDYGYGYPAPPAYAEPPVLADDRQLLEQHIRALQAQLKSLTKRLKDLGTQEADSPEGKE